MTTMIKIANLGGHQVSHPVAGKIIGKEGEWPADQFTFRMLQEGSIKRLDGEDKDKLPVQQARALKKTTRAKPKKPSGPVPSPTPVLPAPSQSTAPPAPPAPAPLDKTGEH